MVLASQPLLQKLLVDLNSFISICGTTQRVSQAIKCLEQNIEIEEVGSHFHGLGNEQGAEICPQCYELNRIKHLLFKTCPKAAQAGAGLQARHAEV